MALYCYKILHLSWQHNCHAMCKISKWSLYHNLDESRMKFPSDVNYDEKVVCEMGHLPIIVRWIGCWHDRQLHTLPTKMIRCAMLAKTRLMGVCLCLEPWAPGAWPEGLYASRVGWCVLYFQRMGSGCCWHPYCFDNSQRHQYEHGIETMALISDWYVVYIGCEYKKLSCLL